MLEAWHAEALCAEQAYLSKHGRRDLLASLKRHIPLHDERSNRTCMYLSDLESLGGHRPQISRVETVGGRRYVQFYQPYAATYFLSASQLKESIAQAEAAARAKHRSGQAVPWWLENQQTSNRRDDGSLLFVREENAGLWLRGQRRAVLPVDRFDFLSVRSLLKYRLSTRRLRVGSSSTWCITTGPSSASTSATSASGQAASSHGPGRSPRAPSRRRRGAETSLSCRASNSSELPARATRANRSGFSSNRRKPVCPFGMTRGVPRASRAPSLWRRGAAEQTSAALILVK